MEVDEVSYDIFDWFPILTCQNIFKHLDGKDVIQASAVNKEWYKLAAEDAQMKKLKLVMQFSRDDKGRLIEVRAAMRILRKSKRKFENIEFLRISSEKATCVLPFLAERAGSWKSVKFQECKISPKIWLEILRIIEPSVEKFHMSYLEDEDQPQPEAPGDYQLLFPRLNSLESEEGEGKKAHYFYRCSSLVKFRWISWLTNRIEDLGPILRNNHKLENLSLRFGDMVIERFSEFSFKLKKFRLGRDYEIAPENLCFFLESQAPTLESLKINADLNQTCLELILNGMPRLKTLKIDFWKVEDAIDNWNGEFPVNSTITFLDLEDFTCNEDEIPFETFIRALTNLKHLKCTYINDGVLSILAQSATLLESFEAGIFDIVRYPEGSIFPNLKKIKVEAFREGAQEPSGESNFAALVTGEMRANPSRYVSLD